MDYDKVFNKPFVFITGAPRSGTSLLTKIIGAHPDIAMIMENIFGNRRRHWKKEAFWNDKNLLRDTVFGFYKQFEEPILGNKVCTPDVWYFEDIDFFCSLFKRPKIIFVIRDAKGVVLSRHKRENHDMHFNDIARNNLPFDFSSRTRSFISSWNHSIIVYERLKAVLGYDLHLVYYEDLISDSANTIKQIFSFLDANFSRINWEWHKMPHYNANGVKISDLKYEDKEIFVPELNTDEVPQDFSMNREEILNYEKFLRRKL